MGNFEVVKKVKYLGVLVGGYGRDIFKYERESVIEKAQKKAAQIKSYIKRVMISQKWEKLCGSYK